MRFKTKEELARFAIEFFLKTGRPPAVEPLTVEEDLKEKKACFVSLYVGGQLRGCVGTVEADKPLYQQIIKYSIESAVHDWRFSPLAEKELKDLKIEVSVLTPLSRYKPDSSEALLNYLKEKKPGVLIKFAGRQALFLPQVWEKLAEPSEFLKELCLKAGVAAKSWEEKTVEFWLFEVEKD